MADEVLDYSGGWPRSLTYTYGGRRVTAVGTVRYIGTPGRGKNLTPAEAGHWLAAQVPIGLVYEASAGWMLGGESAGRAAAKAALADAAACGIGVRCVYLACDIDITSGGQLAAVDACLDGAAAVLGRARVGVYGEADVIDHCVGTGEAAYGWQTQAWSGGRTSLRACLRQEIGYVYPDDVECDRSTVLRDDWGQWPHGMETISMADAASLEVQVRGLADQLSAVYRLLSVGDASDSTGQDKGTHPNNLEAVARRVAALDTKLDMALKRLDALTLGVPAGDPDVLASAVADKLAQRLES